MQVYSICCNCRIGCSRFRSGFPAKPRLGSLIKATLVIAVLLAGRSAAQPPSVAPATDEPPHPLPLLEGQRRPIKDVRALVDKLSSNDAAIEIVAGQSRIVTFKEPFRTVAVGEPAVIDFTVLNQRQIRVVGNHVGDSDLTIITPAPDNRVYAFEVHVVADLDPLRLQLRAAFADASIKISQMRDHVIVEGEARDSGQVTRILETIRAYLISVQAVQARRIRAQAAARGIGALPPGAGPAPEPIPRPAGAAPEAGQPPAGAAPAAGRACATVRSVGCRAPGGVHRAATANHQPAPCARPAAGAAQSPHR